MSWVAIDGTWASNDHASLYYTNKIKKTAQKHREKVTQKKP